LNKLSELISDPNGTLSHTKVWSNIGMFIITITYCWHVYKHELTPDLMLAYGGIVVFGRAASKYIDANNNTTSIEIPASQSQSQTGSNN
jgi:hypothetical protein